jgi:hypothetical protein
MNTSKLKTSIEELVIPNLTLSHVKKGVGQRAYADEIESQFISEVKKEFNDVTEASSVKSTEDVGIGNTLIDVKSSDEDRKFKMPNLISIAKLRKKYYDKPIFYAFVIYSSKQHKIIDIKLFYVWELPWKHLAMQNLGKGQLQIRNMKDFLDDVENFPKNTKDEWYQEFLKQGKIYYTKMVTKMENYRDNWEV